MPEPSKPAARERILEDVRQNPGSSARDVQRRLGLGWGDTAYQLDRLSRAEEIRRERGGWRDYYFPKEMVWADRRTLQALRSPAQRTLLLAITESPGSTFTELVDHTGFARSTVSFHLRKLVDLQLVSPMQTGVESRFMVKEPERLRSLLTNYASSLRDELVDRFVEAFGGLISD